MKLALQLPDAGDALLLCGRCEMGRKCANTEDKCAIEDTVSPREDP